LSCHSERQTPKRVGIAENVGNTFGKLVLEELRHADFEGMPGDSKKGVGIFIPATGMRSLMKPTGVVTLYRRHKESDIPETSESSDRRKMKKN
jgi:hypothetical protein